MQILFLTLLFCCHALGRPSDPVVREFGTQPNNPNVKIFSTYPTLKPPVIKDNPNDLEKGPDQEKYQKDETEVSETKGEEITKAQSNLTDANTLDQPESVTDETVLDIFDEVSSAAGLSQSDDSTTPENENQKIYTEEVSPVPSKDSASDKLQETKSSDKNSQIEMEADQGGAVGSIPFSEDVIVPMSEDDLSGPLSFDAPVTIIPAIAEELGDIPEEEIIFAIPDMDLNEDEIYELNEEANLFPAGVILPELVTVEAAPNEGDERTILPLSEGSSTFLPPIAEELEGTMDANTELPRDVSDSIRPVAEMSEDIFEPMASLTGENGVIDPVVEKEEETIIDQSQGNNLNEELANSQDEVMDKTPMGEGDVGVSLSMIDAIPPIVEAEPEMPSESTSTSDGEVREKDLSSDIRVNDLKKSDRITMEENSTNETLTEETTAHSIQMAGFMSEASKSVPESEKPTEETIPSATDLSLILNIKDKEENVSPSISNESQVQTQVEPIDQLDEIDTQQAVSTSPTEESVPTLNPVELTPEEESNDDPTLNEAI